MSNTPAQWWHKRWITAIPTLPTDTAWAAFAAPGVIEARIEALRLEQADPICTACGSSAVSAQKWCPACQRMLAVRLFHRNKARHDGLGSWCGDCANAAEQRRLRRRILRAVEIAS